MHSQPRKTITTRARLVPPKPKRWNHQDELMRLRGKQITIVFLDGSRQQVLLLEADQFALLVRHLGEQSTLIVWKHDLTSVAEALQVGGVN